MEGMERMPRPQPERDLESQAHRETHEVAARKEIMAAIDRTLSSEERDLLYSIGQPGLSEEERATRKDAFNALHAGTPDAEEAIEGRRHEDVQVNVAGTVISISRDDRGRFSVA